MKKAVIYARVSTKDQEREGYSVPAQLRILREYAKKIGFETVREFHESESAGKAGRTKFGHMVSLILSDRSIEAILVEKTDRLYRNFRDKVTIDDLDIDVHFVKDNRIIGKSSKSSDKFVNDIETAQARFYLNNLSDEVKKGQLQKARQGSYPGGIVPIGYVRNKLSKSIELDPDRSSIVRALFESYADGDKSIDNIHAIAKQSGLTYPRSDRVVARSEMERLLKKEFYCGKFKWKDVVYSGDHPAIVDPVLFARVQEVFRERSNGKFSKHDFTFGRLITCGECGNAVTAEIKKGKYVYYHCTGYGGKHKRTYVPESKIDRQYSEIIGAATIPDEWYGFLSECLKSESQKKSISVARDRDRLETECLRIRGLMRKAYEDKVIGVIDDDLFQSLYRDYQSSLHALEYRLENLPIVMSQSFDMAQRTIELSHQAGPLYLKANPSQKRRLLKAVLSNSLLNGTTVYPVYRKAFQILVDGVQSENMRRGRDSPTAVFASNYSTADYAITR